MSSSLEWERLHPGHEPHFTRFPSRRSTVFSAKGAVATSQPLACQAGIEVLNKGGNAADAAVAMAAALNVTEPSMTGVGGDMFCLFYDATTKTVRGINGSGRAPKALTLEHLRQRGVNGTSIPLTDLNSVTVPGAAAGWCKTLETFGSGISMKEVLAPAIRMAREGVPAHEINSRKWQASEKLIKEASVNWPARLILKNPPLPSHIMTHPDLADTFEAIATYGKDGYYTGRIAEAIVEVVQGGGGVMSLEDLAECEAEVVQPIKYDFRVGKAGDSGVTLWECPPNGQGLTALMALGIIEAVEKKHNFDILKLEHNSALYLHILIEALRLAFADTRYYVADPRVVHVPVEEMLTPKYLAQRADLIQLDKTIEISRGSPVAGSDTVYLATADKEGNSCSFIASNYAGFGTGAIPAGCGFTLQNRGAGFTLEEGHPNCLEGGKRPYHTIIPGMATKGDEILLSFGVMGAFMQPQGHIQILLNKLRGFTPQACLDAPRFCISSGTPTGGQSDRAGDFNSEIWFEEGIPDSVLDELRAMGHQTERASHWLRDILGKGQMIQAVRDPSGRTVWACGSDLRGDGCGLAQI
ncbi:gamma-glutamyltransferase [Tremella mesenterica]|uniref:Gamma-glutamyltransferase n=1 Tax=Tremella mesenterica TaxID=5217 RepID=A0A4Q1BRP9_TREME|nr:gamma-glutamyltransferase [Tremella mesenterica]